MSLPGGTGRDFVCKILQRWVCREDEADNEPIAPVSQPTLDVLSLRGLLEAAIGGEETSCTLVFKGQLHEDHWLTCCPGKTQRVQGGNVLVKQQRGLSSNKRHGHARDPSAMEAQDVKYSGPEIGLPAAPRFGPLANDKQDLRS